MEADVLKRLWFGKEYKTAVFLDYDAPLSSSAQAFTDGTVVHPKTYNHAIQVMRVTGSWHDSAVLITYQSESLAFARVERVRGNLGSNTILVLLLA